MKKKSLTIPGIVKRKGREKLTMLTAYDAPTARILDACGVDIILVGDSVGTAVLGYESTIPVDLDMMLHHLRAVARGAPNTIIVGDMPFGSFQISQEETVRNAFMMIKAGAHAIKIEGTYFADVIPQLVASGIPVMGHIGLTPQSIHRFGGYRVQGKRAEGRKKLVEEAVLLEQNGVFSMVVEGVPPSVAELITKTVKIPTIGIGAGPGCDGQVLVINDLMGLDPDFNPRFVKQYVDLHAVMTQAVSEYLNEVTQGVFPGPEHCYPEGD